MTDSTRLLLVRHGRTDHNVALRLTGWGDPELDALGLAQARLVGRYIARHYHPDRLFSSPLCRALETARRIGRECRLEPIPLDDLREVHFGHVEGLTEAEFAERYPELHQRAQDFHDMAFCWPGGESRGEFGGRVRRAVDAVVEASRGGTAVVATHGGVIANLVSTLKHGTPAYWLNYLVKNCSITELLADRDGLHVVRFNEAGFLPDPARTDEPLIEPAEAEVG